MTTSSLYDRVSKILITKFEVDPVALAPDASFDALGLDSLAQVELGEVLGELLGLDIDDEDVIEQSCLGDVVALLERKAAAV